MVLKVIHIVDVHKHKVSTCLIFLFFIFFLLIIILSLQPKNMFYFFNFFKIFVVIVNDNVSPCDPTPCGTNAICKEKNGAGACYCINNFYGDPYLNCRPECIQNSDCPYNQACFNTKCRDPCINTCGINAECHTVNHSPVCSCPIEYTGNPLRSCQPVETSKNNVTTITNQIFFFKLYKKNSSYSLHRNRNI